MTLYISGPITGVKKYKKNFESAKKRLNKAGYLAFNPVTHGIENLSWSANMKCVLPRLFECDGVATLPGWEGSKGARLEADIAVALDMPFKSVDEWCKEKEMPRK